MARGEASNGEGECDQDDEKDCRRSHEKGDKGESGEATVSGRFANEPNVAVGDVLEVCDRYGVWYEAKVLRLRDAGAGREIQVRSD